MPGHLTSLRRCMCGAAFQIWVAGTDGASATDEALCLRPTVAEGMDASSSDPDRPWWVTL